MSVDGGVVRLNDVARRARDEWGAAIAVAESTWPGSASLRAPLEAFVSQLPLVSALPVRVRDGRLAHYRRARR